MGSCRIESFCRHFYACTFIPVSLYYGEKQVCRWPAVDFDFSCHWFGLLSAENRLINALTTENSFHYGLVKSKNSSVCVLLGPVISTRCDALAANRFMFSCHVAASRSDAISDFLDSIPLRSYQQFLNCLSFIYFELNDEEIDVFDYFEKRKSETSNLISSIYSKKAYEAKEAQQYHHSYPFECEMLSYVKDGKTDALRRLLKNPNAVIEGMIAGDSIRQLKNMFIVSATLLSRSAIQGGLDVESAFQLSDVYILEMEKMNKADTISRLMYTMVFDFAEHIASRKVPDGISPCVSASIQYIFQNTNQPLSVCDVARHVGKSRSYLSQRFKEELGIPPSAFIKRCKLEESKNLLSFTDKPISEISSYLCFSSQSHFQNAFKNEYQITPLQYRKTTNPQ